MKLTRNLSGLVPEDFYRIDIPSFPSMDCRGKMVCFQKKRVHKGQYITEIILWTRETGRTQVIGTGQYPALSPDGRFVAYVEGMRGEILTVHELETGNVSRMESGTSMRELVWNRSSRSLLITAKEKSNPFYNDTPPLLSAQLVTRLKFKEDNNGNAGIWDETWRQVFCVPCENGHIRKIMRLTDGNRDHRHPFWIDDVTAGYVKNTNEDPDMPDQFDREGVFSLPCEGGSERKIVAVGGPVEAVSASQGGDRIAFVGHDYSFFEATNRSVFIADVNAGSVEQLSLPDISAMNHILSDIGLDPNASAPVWINDNSLICVTTMGGDSALWNLAPGKKPERMSQEHRGIFGLCGDFEGRVACIVSSNSTPATVIVREKNGEEIIVWQSWEPQTSVPGSISVSVSDGVREFWYLPPVGGGFPKGVVLNVHGGPHQCYGNVFNYDFQLLAAAGYAVLYGNPAGSLGYGQNVAAKSKHDWGGTDFQEIRTAIDAAKKRFALKNTPFAIIGGSYGGFMANWAIGHSDIFSCAVSERGTSNRFSQAGTSDCAYRYGVFEFDGFPWDNPQFYSQHSPISFVNDIHTPLLLLHGEEDVNCHITQSEELFTALKVLDKNALLVRFPGESHEYAAIGSPAARMDRYCLLLWWFAKHLDAQVRENVDPE